jgi:hypothetical protein
MKLNHLNDEERQILKLVVEEYYVVLPPALQVHSLFATHILSNTLHRFGIRTRVLPCRLWCSSLQPPLPHHREVTGGVVNYWNPDQWNGHVVCLAGDWLVDVALYHLNPAFNYEVPKLIARQIYRPEPGVYTRYRLNRTTEFVWYRLPANAPAVSVAGYEDFIDRFVNDLVAHIRRLLGLEEDVVDDLASGDEVVPDDGIPVNDEASSAAATESPEAKAEQTVAAAGEALDEAPVLLDDPAVAIVEAETADAAEPAAV